MIAIGEDFLVGVNVLEEEVEGGDALLEAAFEVSPIRRRG